MFQRIGAAAYKADLNNTLELDKLLKYPHKNYKTIHIAGTNGKGSVSHFIASILQQSGKKVGLYTSPHLKDFRERIRINGKMIPKDYVCDFVKNYKPHFEEIKPSFFEMTFAMATNYFSDEKVDIAVIETGMGGRLDSTNIINPILSIITNIGWDHMAFLGDTLEKIATEKAGIIKPGVPVVIGETQSEVQHVFIQKAKDSTIFWADKNFNLIEIESFSPEKTIFKIFQNSIGSDDKIFTPLGGHYQSKNIITTLMSVSVLQSLGIDIPKTAVLDGFRKVKETGISGRWEVINKKPLTIADTAHNSDGLSFVLEQLKLMPFRTMRIVFGVVNDKDIDHILSILPKNAEYYFCKADIPRGLEAKILNKKAKKHGLNGTIYSSVAAALKTAQNQAHQEDLIFIGGSIFIVAEVL